MRGGTKIRFPPRIKPKIKHAADKASGGKRRGGPRPIYPKKVVGIRNKLIEDVRRGKVKRVVMDDVISGIYEKTGRTIWLVGFAQRLREANPEVEIIWGEIKSGLKSRENIELSCKVILIAKKLNFRKAGIKFSDDWLNALENHFRKNNRFPDYNSFRKDYFETFNLEGFERIKRQIIEHYWKLLKSQ